MHYSIQPADPKDYPELVDIWEASVRKTHHFLKESDLLYFKPLILNEYFYAVDLHCLKDQEAIVGFLGTKDGKIEMLFVLPAYMGKGAGKTLLLYAINSLNATLVDVNEQNSSAVGFYQHMGFETINRSDLDGLGKPYPMLHMQLSKTLKQKR
ncbi:MAG TPA: GNAT family N-acetyltransferase [Cytophagales bacterium]|nr:GNAT family N-acetyltransferase [Cytophagales bacterium]HCR53114.1 GNAT family N-acetyltransferase [Cytophagales bacterium]